MARLVSRVVLRHGWPRTRGRLPGMPVATDVEIARDRWGIPHISAGSFPDLLCAQGFVHAQDRLWQMETLRRLCAGRLSEVAGRAALGLDWFSRAAGFAEMRRRTAAAMSDEEASLCQSYADGVNACVAGMGKRLPLEFATLHLAPEPWTVEDCAAVLPYVSFVQTFWPWAAKLLAISQAGRLTEEEWNDMFPVFPGTVLEHDPWFDRAAGLKFGSIRPEALSFHSGLSPQGTGSNNWTVAQGADGLPLLSDDPHMGASLPAVWYFCHLRVPNAVNAAGTSIPGSPGVVLGRTERAAWGVTNFMLDAADVLTYRLDPADPRRYRTPDGYRVMEERPVTIGLPGGQAATLPLFVTVKGPVVTTLEKGVTAAAVMHWYGTRPEDGLRDRTFQAVFRFMKAGCANEILDAARSWKYLSMNFVAADAAGHIGWQVSGGAPVRTGYTGRLPGDASAGDDWTGWVPPEDLPRVQDPAEGFLATANCPPQGFPGAVGLSCYWCVPYRQDRIRSALRAMDRPGVADFAALQMDVHSLQADRLLPLLARFTLGDPRAVEAARLLAEWDRELTAESAGAALFEVFLTEIRRSLLGERLGSDLHLYFNALSYPIENEIFERPRSPWWKGDPPRIIEKALVDSMMFCESRMGRNRRRWRWGRLHRHAFHHRGATSRAAAWLMDPTSLPAAGDSSTVNVSWSQPSLGSYEVTTVPSMRLIASLGNPDGLSVALPLGQSGQPGHRHYDDLLPLWWKGDLVPLPLTEEGVRAVARERLVLSPR